MALSDPRVFFGIHSLCAYSRATALPYGPELRVLEGSSLSMAGDVIELQGGSSKFSWAAEDGYIKSELDIKASEYPDWLFQLFLGTTPSDQTTDATGTISAAANVNGTSVVAATGILSTISITSAKGASLKFTKYVIKVASATTVDVYAKSSVDFGSGEAGSFQNDLMKITASPLTVVQSTGVAVPNYGITLTGGAGTIGMTTGDTASFEVLPISSKGMTVTIGSQNSTFPEFGALCVAQKRGNKEMFEIDVFRCKGIGFPLDFNKNAFAKNSIKAKVLYDSAQDGVFKLRYLAATT